MTGPPRILVAGLGNPYRSDDGAGVLVARALLALDLNSKVAADLSVVQGGLDVLALLDEFPRYSHVILIDTVTGCGPPGSVLTWNANSVPCQNCRAGISSHGLSACELLNLASVLCPVTEIFVIGIEGKQFQPGTECSPDVLQAIGTACSAVLRQVEECMSTV